MNIQLLPTELINHVIGYLDSDSISSFSLLNWHFHTIVNYCTSMNVQSFYLRSFEKLNNLSDSKKFEKGKKIIFSIVEKVFVTNYHLDVTKHFLILMKTNLPTQALHFLKNFRNIDFGADDNSAICKAAFYGHFEIVKLLCTYEKVNPAANNNEPIFLAAMNNHFNIVEFFLQFKGVHPIDENNKMMIYAAQYGHLEFVKFIMTYPNVNSSLHRNLGIYQAACYGHLEIIKFLLTCEGGNTIEISNDAMIQASKFGHLEVVKFFLTCNGVDPAAQNDKAIISAAEFGHLEIVKVLLETKRVDPAAQDNLPIVKAAAGGFLEIVEFLMQYPNINRANKNKALLEAATNGKLEIIEFLLDKERNMVDIGILINSAISNGHHHVLKFLLTLMDIRYFKDKYLFFQAVCNDHLDVVKILLFSGIDFSELYKYAIVASVKSNSFDVFKFLIENLYIKDEELPVSLMYEAINRGHFMIIEFLSKYETFNKLIQSRELLSIALEKRYLKIVKLLIRLSRKNTHSKCKEAFIYAARKGHLKLLKFLISCESFVLNDEVLKLAIDKAKGTSRNKVVSFLQSIQTKNNFL